MAVSREGSAKAPDGVDALDTHGRVDPTHTVKVRGF